MTVGDWTISGSCVTFINSETSAVDRALTITARPYLPEPSHVFHWKSYSDVDCVTSSSSSETDSNGDPIAKDWWATNDDTKSYRYQFDTVSSVLAMRFAPCPTIFPTTHFVKIGCMNLTMFQRPTMGIQWRPRMETLPSSCGPTQPSVRPSASMLARSTLQIQLSSNIVQIF